MGAEQQILLREHIGQLSKARNWLSFPLKIN